MPKSTTNLFGAAASKRRQDFRTLADEDLMALVRGGEPRAFEVIFDRHSGAAFSLAYRMCGRRAMADDAQEGISAFLQKRQPTWSGR